MRLPKVFILLVVLVLLAACTPSLDPAGGDTNAPGEVPADMQPSVTDQPTTPTATDSSTDADRPLAAWVNGQPIYLVDYERQVAQYQAAMVASGVDVASSEGQERLLQAREQILNWMIEHVLIEQAAAEQGIVITDEEVEAALAQIVQDVGGEEAFQDQLERNGMTRQEVWDELRAELIGTAVIERVAASVPTSAEHVHARHILVDTREEAERILAQLQAGADFTELARAYSQDESTRAAGGDLVFFPRGVLLAPEVEEAAFGLQPGQISSVIQSSFGFHIVQVIERDPERTLSPENLQLLRDRAVQEWIEALWAQAVIERYVSQDV
jgi:parvulin-like peptidyl-prolyl isomerase